MPWTPSDDPEWLKDRQWSPEQIAMAEAYHAAAEQGGIASGLVLLWTQFGPEKTASFIGDAKYYKFQLIQAAADLKRVGGFPDLARVVAVAVQMKPTLSTWKTRLVKNNRRRGRRART
jgi:hypothetical protein